MRRGLSKRSIALTFSAVVSLVAVNSCSFGAESTPRQVPDRQRGSLSIDFGSPLSLNGEAHIYLLRLDIDSETNLGSAPRAIDETDEEIFLRQLIDDLIAGPSNSEKSQDFGTAIPVGTRVLNLVAAGKRVTLDLSGPLNQLPDEELIIALAQIVYTMSEGFYIREVIIKIDGQNVEWPRQDGTRKSDPLTIFDYPTAAITSQPAYPGIISTESVA
ncbi:MAG: hypothetical protein RL119_122 [Actinomycetota bacterium]